MVMGISYLKTTKTMNFIGVTIRKINISGRGKKESITPKIYNKQILTLHRKLKKLDEKISTTYVIERDNHKNKFHAHLLINYENENNIYNQLSRFIGGNIWKEREERLQTIYGCYGKYGEVDTHLIYDEKGFTGYLNKHEQINTLI